MKTGITVSAFDLFHGRHVKMLGEAERKLWSIFTAIATQEIILIQKYIIKILRY
jgi:hypothetical protein